MFSAKVKCVNINTKTTQQPIFLLHMQSYIRSSDNTLSYFSLSFTGKEKDAETGYGYFGARYMDHELMTMWLSVDPMADKYPNI